ncbi:MAG: type 3 dihydrofolate reductase [Gammaproteobacteria bacterium]
MNTVVQESGVKGATRAGGKRTISLIVAMDRNRLIGADNGLPWRLPADLKYFKSITMGKAIIMGRKTYESIGRPLPGRTNIVVTRERGYQAPGCIVVHSIDEALARPECGDEVMIIGGASFYEQMLPRADRLYVTFIDAEFAGDTYFPAFDLDAWREIRREDHEPDEQNRYRYSFTVLERKQA